jgi:putative ABC transport system substrate-binding protein
MTSPKPALRRIGILEMAAPDPDRLALWDIFRNGLRELGHIEGAEVVLEFRWAEGRQERLASAAEDLVRSGVDVLVTAGTPAAAAASRATTEIPVIMATGVGLGTQLTDGAQTPNPNVTGFSDLPPGVSEKRLQLLQAALADRGNPSSPLALRETQDAARTLGITVQDYWVAGLDDFNETLAAMAKDGIGGFVIAPGAMFFAQRAKLAALAAEHRLAAMSVRREYCEAGCLMAYGAPIRWNYRQAAVYVSRILDGMRPSELPVEEPTEFVLLVNLTTAKAIGIELPPALLAQAETVGA